jgi:AraC family transcriptional regulator of adaptative response/methylated-DNA-[protein]-cysteine methyltransferase
VTQATYEVGHDIYSRFHTTADDLPAMAPTIYRPAAALKAIRFAIGECSLGSILVARSELGLCAILLGDDPEALLGDLHKRFPQAELYRGDAEFEGLVTKVVGFVEAPGTGLDLRLDVGGTAFQHRVWQALREIPAGRTATYSEIAGRIGAPAAVRAVAGACAANPLAVAIPCHRVVRTDGSLSGYRWGVERKRTLLEWEARP